MVAVAPITERLRAKPAIALKFLRAEIRPRFEVDCLDVRRTSEDAFVAAVCDQAAIGRLRNVLKGRPVWASRFYCVYLVGPDHVPTTKIGKAFDPFSRLKGLQVGYWDRLHIKGLIWAQRYGYMLESGAHIVAKARGARLSREWTSFSTKEAALALRASALGHDGPVCTTETFLDEWAPAYAEWANANPSLAARPLAPNVIGNPDKCQYDYFCPEHDVS